MNLRRKVMFVLDRMFCAIALGVLVLAVAAVVNVPPAEMPGETAKARGENKT